MTLTIRLTLSIKALALAIVHFFFFYNLDGTLVHGAYLRQSWNTALSFLLVTLARAAMVGSVGLCFAQYLWDILRRKTLGISEIEQMFTMRQNLISLAAPRVVWKAPVLCLMAGYVWLIGIAMIYPPGALTVKLDIHPKTELFNMSVLQPKLSSNFDPLDFVNFGISGSRIEIFNSSHAAFMYAGL